MNRYHFLISTEGGKLSDLCVEDVANVDDATNVALNVLHKYITQTFPPPENISIDIADQWRQRVATVKMTFEIEFVDGSSG